MELLGTWANGDCWKVGGWKVLSGVEELRVMGGPRSASKWGLLLRILLLDEVDGDSTGDEIDETGDSKGVVAEVMG